MGFVKINGFGIDVDAPRTVVQTASTSVSPSAGDSGTEYLLTAPSGLSFHLPASAGCVVGETVLYVFAYGANVDVLANGTDYMFAWDTIVAAPILGGELVLNQGGYAEFRFISTNADGHALWAVRSNGAQGV